MPSTRACCARPDLAREPRSDLDVRVDDHLDLVPRRILGIFVAQWQADVPPTGRQQP